ncbi:MAG TPA: acyl-CoA dehydrogenase family protein [Acidimicrobiales bacterium]|nr:acyl-CoA dehydrogenase family protein [Acidimicrobiales bacterium]
MSLGFELVELSPAERALQQEVREFLLRELPRGSFEPGRGMDGPSDAGFSKKMAAQGWIGMALPKRYGGHERGAVDRFIVVEEMLRWGAPLHFHWTADRQSAQVILKFGTEEQRERFLPPICAGELSFAIGLSEPDAGSDLAGIKTRATKVEGGWLVNGTKIWTTNAQNSDWFIVLCRTSDAADRHDGLSQLLIDLRSEGVEINPIPFLDGGHHFNEVVLRDVFVADDLLVGEEGRGWQQTGNELSYERGGPDRLLSSWLLVEQFLREQEGAPLGERALALLGWAMARFWGIRQLSLAVARMIDRGGAPATESALVKEMATRFEQDVIHAVGELVDTAPALASASLLQRLLAGSILAGPSYTIRGGTNEVLIGVVAKGLR